MADLCTVKPEHDDDGQADLHQAQHRLAVLLQHARLVLHDHPFPQIADSTEDGHHHRCLPPLPPPFPVASFPIRADEPVQESSIRACSPYSSPHAACEFAPRKIVEWMHCAETEDFLHDSLFPAAASCSQAPGFLSQGCVHSSGNLLLSPNLEGNNFMVPLPLSCQLESQTQDYLHRPNDNAASLPSSSSLACRLELQPWLPSSVENSNISSKSLVCIGDAQNASWMFQKSRPLQIKRDGKQSKPGKRCVGCNAGIGKRRRAWLDTACLPSSNVSEIESKGLTKQIRRENRRGFYRVPNAILALPALLPEVRKGWKRKGLSGIPRRRSYNKHGFMQTPGKQTLVWSLIHVVSEAGDGGLTVSQAVQKLVDRGFSWGFKTGHKSRFRQVEEALKSKQDFIELAGSRFVFKSNYLTGSQNQVKAVVPEPAVGVRDSNRESGEMENQSDLLQYCLDILEAREPNQRCHKLNGSRWHSIEQVINDPINCTQPSRRYNNDSASTLPYDSRQADQHIICGVVNIDEQEGHLPLVEFDPTRRPFFWFLD